LKNLVHIWLFLLSPAVFAQIEFYSVSGNGELMRSNTVNCQSQSLGMFQSFADIAITPDGHLYGVNGYIYLLDPGSQTMTPLFTPVDAAGNYSAGTGLTALDDTHLITDRFDSLFMIDLSNQTATPLGKTGFYCMGDMAFHNGKLYMVSQTNMLVRIELDSTTYSVTGVENLGQLETPTHSIYSLFSTFETCTSTEASLFAIDNDRIYRIDPANAQVTEVCMLNTGAIFYGGAAITNPALFVVPDLQIPNVFTPNGDGYNDHFVIPDLSKSRWDLEVFNRWGRSVYSQKN